MRKLAFMVFLVVLLSCKETPEDIIQKNIEMRGGKANFDRVKNLLLFVNISSMGMELPVKMYIVRPNSMRTEVTFGGQNVVTILLPDTAIAIVDNNVTSLPPDAKNEMRRNLQTQLNYLRSELMNLSENGGKVLEVTKTKFKGKDAHMFKISYPDGSISYVFIDRDTYLNLGNRIEKIIEGQKLETETVFLDYRKTNGLIVPFKTEVYNGKNLIAKLSIDSLAINTTFDSKLFTW
jgi:outer membrane lipoprotein-sorting protein